MSALVSESNDDDDDDDDDDVDDDDDEHEAVFQHSPPGQRNEATLMPGFWN